MLSSSFSLGWAQLPPLLATLLATALAGFGSVLLAAVLLRRLHATGTDFLLSLAAGALLCTAFIHLLPEAVESGAPAHKLFGTLFVALVLFFLLNKAELYHHGHEHHGHEHHGHEHHGHEHPAPTPDQHSHQHHRQHPHHHHQHVQTHGSSGWALLLGDAVHCLGDGMLIAAACLSSPWLGLLVALAVFAHEVPHHMGDLVVLQGRQGLRPALSKLLGAGSATVLGGLLGYAFFSAMAGWMPYLLMVAAGSFIYVALADLIPQLQRHWGARDTVQQVLGLGLGAGLVLLATQVLADHAH